MLFCFLHQGDELILKPSDVVTFTVDIEAPQKEGTYHGEIIMKTIFEVCSVFLVCLLL